MGTHYFFFIYLVRHVLPPLDISLHKTIIDNNLKHFMNVFIIE